MVDVLEVIEGIVGKEAKVTKTDFEGPEIGIYTANPLYFLEHEDAVRKIAVTLKKRVNVRSDPKILTPPEKARDMILEIVPVDAGITNMWFLEELGTVRIEAKKPGLVIGKDGETLKEIVKKTGWMVQVVRAPASESSVLKGIRGLEARHLKERLNFLRTVSGRIFRGVRFPNTWVRLHALGGFNEVGRSMLMLETKNSKIIIDAGVNVGNEKEFTPLLEDEIDGRLDEIDAVVISHAHLDHIGFLPMLYKMGYDGPVYCTPPTRDLGALLLLDFIDVFLKEGREPPFTERDVKKAMLHCITRNYGEVTDITPDMRLTFHNAGHILGSATVHIHVGNGLYNVLYTGDIKYAPTRMLSPATTKYPRIETLVIESTYGGREDIHPPREKSEEMLKQIILDTMEKKGTVLIPVFAVGRAQEILLTLEEFYRKEGWEWPVYLDGMIREASAIHTAYPEFMRRDLQRRILSNDSPFEADFIVEVKGRDRKSIAEEGEAIILAPSGSLTGGPAVEYFKYLAEDERNALVLVGYQFEGSLGRKLQRGVREIPIKAENGKLKPLSVRMRVETLHGFSGHADRRQLENFVARLNPRPKRIIVDHGDPKKVREFSRDVARRFRVETLAPRNLDVVRLL